MAKRLSALPLLKNVPIKADPVMITAPTPTVEWVKVTPDVATKWLDETNSNNRKVREDYVMRLASDMSDGKWKGKNGEAIRFDRDGRLVDGQHRLWACVVSGKPFDTLLVRGINSNEYSSIGIGMKKSLADFLGPVDGEKNTALLASTIRLVHHYRNGNLDQLKNGKVAPTVLALQKTLKDNPEVRESVHFIASHIDIRNLLTPSIGCLIHYAGSCEGKQAKVERFLERVGTGLEMTGDDPAYLLRRYLLGQRKRGPGVKRADMLYTLALAIKAWNAVSDGKKLGVLKWTASEEFPKL